MNAILIPVFLPSQLSYSRTGIRTRDRIGPFAFQASRFEPPSPRCRCRVAVNGRNTRPGR